MFDCSSLAYVPAEANKKTATREKEKTPRMFCSELARDSCILTWIREERLPLLLPVSLFVQNRNFIPIWDATIGYFGLSVTGQLQYFQHRISAVYNDNSNDTRFARESTQLLFQFTVKRLRIGWFGVNLSDHMDCLQHIISVV